MFMVKSADIMVRFLREVRAEMTKVTYPTREDTLRLTAVVIAISIVVGAYLGGLDYVFNELLRLLIS